MNISLEIGLLVGSLLIFGSILISKTGYRFGIPTLLMFLVAGSLSVRRDTGSVSRLC